MKIKSLVGLGLASLIIGGSMLPVSANTNVLSDSDKVALYVDNSHSKIKSASKGAARYFIEKRMNASHSSHKEQDNVQDDKENHTDEAVESVKKHEYFIYFDKLLEKYKNEIAFEEKVYTANSYHDLMDIVKDIEETMPDKFKIQSKYMTAKDLREEYDKALDLFEASQLMNYHTLVSYERVTNSRGLEFKQMTNEAGYSARHISAALNEFAEYLAKEFKVDEEVENHVEQSILNVYNFLYDNYEYNASGMVYMQVGNLSNGEMACNGFSRLAYEVLNKMGIETEIRGGYSHFWNVITLDDQRQITFDVTTDILLKEKGKTLGNDTATHIANTAPVGIYSAEYREWQYNKVASYDLGTNSLN